MEIPSFSTAAFWKVREIQGSDPPTQRFGGWIFFFFFFFLFIFWLMFLKTRASFSLEFTLPSSWIRRLKTHTNCKSPTCSSKPSQHQTLCRCLSCLFQLHPGAGEPLSAHVQRRADCWGKGSSVPGQAAQSPWASGHHMRVCLSYFLIWESKRKDISCHAFRTVYMNILLCFSLACPFLLTVIRQGRTGDQGPWRARAPDSQREGPGRCSRTSQPFIPALGPLIVSPPLMPSPLSQQTLIQM